MLHCWQAAITAIKKCCHRIEFCHCLAVWLSVFTTATGLSSSHFMYWFYLHKEWDGRQAKDKRARIKILKHPFTKGPIHSGQTYLFCLLCVHDVQWLHVFKYVMPCKCRTIFSDDDGGRKIMFSLSGPSLTYLTLPCLCSMWLRVCSLIGEVVWDPVAACLEDWHNNIQEASAYLEGMGRRTQHSRQVKNCCRNSHKMYLN